MNPNPKPQRSFVVAWTITTNPQCSFRRTPNLNVLTHSSPIIQLWKPFSFFASKPFFESTQEESFLRCSSSQAPYWCMHFPSFASYTCHTTYLCTLLFILFYFSFCWLWSNWACLFLQVEIPKVQPQFKPPFLGFTKTAEVWNSRACMIGIIGVFIVEFVSIYFISSFLISSMQFSFTYSTWLLRFWIDKNVVV